MNFRLTESERLFEELITSIDRGMFGLNTGLSTGIPAFDKAIGGIQKKTYNLLFAGEGVGKSTFALHAYILYPIMNHFHNQLTDPEYKVDLKIFYYSLEVDRVDVLGKMLVWIIYKKTNIMYSMRYLFSQRLYLINEDVYKLVLEYKPLIIKILDEVLTIVDKPMTADDIKKDMISFAISRGRKSFVTSDDGTRIRVYKPHNPNEHVILVVDTLTNLKADDDKEAKEIKEHSNNCKHGYRNLYHYTIVNVTHSNREITNAMRTKSGEIYPNKNDISITSQPSRDANNVICLFAPYELANPNNDLHKFEGYDIKTLGSRYINVGILKSRNGSNLLRVSLLYYGECGYFEQLASANSLTKKDYLDYTSKGMIEQELTAKEKADLITKNKIKMNIKT